MFGIYLRIGSVGVLGSILIQDSYPIFNCVEHNLACLFPENCLSIMPDLQIQSFIRHKNNLYEIEIVLGLRKPIGLIFVEKKYFSRINAKRSQINAKLPRINAKLFVYIYTCKRGMFLIYISIFRKNS